MVRPTFRGWPSLPRIMGMMEASQASLRMVWGERMSPVRVFPAPRTVLVCCSRSIRTTTWALVVAGAWPPAAVVRRQISMRASARRRSAGRGSRPPFSVQGLGAVKGVQGCGVGGGGFGVQVAADCSHPVLQRAQPQRVQGP